MKIKDLLKQGEELLDLTLDGWDRHIYFDMSKLAEECGEVAECLNKTALTDEDLAGELADVMIVVTIIALKRNIDLEKALIDKQVKRIEKLTKRFHSGKTPGPAKRASI